MRPRARASSPPPWPAGDGAARAAHGRDNSVRRRRGPGEDHPGRRDGYCRAPAATATNRSPFRNLGSGTGLRPGRPDPGTTRRPFRKSFYKMRSVMIVQSRSRYGSHPWPRRPVPGSLPVGPGHDQWSAGQKNGLRGGLPSPVLPGSGPGGRRSASELSPASQPFLPAPGLPGTPFGLAPSFTSQTIFTLHGAHDGRLGPKAPACTGQTSWLRRKLRQRSGPVPGARYGVPGRQPQTRPAPHSPASGGSPPPRGTAAFMLPGSRPQDHSLAVAVSGLLRIERFATPSPAGHGPGGPRPATVVKGVANPACPATGPGPFLLQSRV